VGQRIVVAMRKWTFGTTKGHSLGYSLIMHVRFASSDRNFSVTVERIRKFMVTGVVAGESTEYS
jgi:hypothetical protein